MWFATQITYYKNNRGVPLAFSAGVAVYSTANRAYCVTAGDIDRDGDIDLVGVWHREIHSLYHMLCVEGVLLLWIVDGRHQHFVMVRAQGIRVLSSAVSPAADTLHACCVACPIAFIGHCC